MSEDNEWPGTCEEAAIAAGIIYTPGMCCDSCHWGEIDGREEFYEHIIAGKTYSTCCGVRVKIEQREKEIGKEILE